MSIDYPQRRRLLGTYEYVRAPALCAIYVHVIIAHAARMYVRMCARHALSTYVIIIAHGRIHVRAVPSMCFLK